MARRKALKHSQTGHQKFASRSERSPERSLDPSDWVAFRDAAGFALDLALEHLEKARQRPVWQPVPPAVLSALNLPLPAAGEPIEQVLSDFQKLIQPYATGNTHPRFLGWVHGAGLPDGVIAEMLAASLNANLGGRDHGAIYVERLVLEWCKQIFDFPDKASGLLVSGTSMATLIGLAVARHTKAAKAGCNIRKQGTGGLKKPLVAYTSCEAHSSVARAFEVLGLGSDALRAVPTRHDFTMDADALDAAIRKDSDAGLDPFAVIATAGTVNTGAIDDLGEISKIAQNRGLWLHVDGAFGGLAVLAPDLRPRLAGIEQADSLAFDFHKWMHVPYDAGCILVRDGKAHLAAFGSRPDYLAGAERGLAAGEPWFCEYGPELSRSFRALKIWFALKTHGAEAFGAKILDNCRHAQTLAEKVTRHPNLELLAPVSLNIVCFRYRDDDLSTSDLDTVNEEIVIALQELGIAAPSTTRINGALAIRANFTNHRTQMADVDILIEAIARLAPDIAVGLHTAEPAPAPRPPLGRRARKAALSALLELPDLAPLARDVHVTISQDLVHPFAVGPGNSLTIQAGVLDNKFAARVTLRHALECLNWPVRSPPARSQNDPAREIAHALAAARTAAIYLRLRPTIEQARAYEHLPSWLSRGYQRLGEIDPWSNLSVLLDPSNALLTNLLAISGGNPSSARAIAGNIALKARASHLFAELACVAVPTEQLLIGGDDPRLELQTETGANLYGAEPRPVADELSYASSTAASPSPRSYQCAEALRQRLIEAVHTDELAGALDDEAAALMCELTDRLADSEADCTDIVLAPSGTHAVHTAIALARGEGDRPLLSIVLAPDETGSGVPLAASGKQFFTSLATTNAFKAGDHLPHLTDGGLTSMTIEIRTPQGRLRDSSAVDADLEAAVSSAIAAGARVIVFALDSSKLGTSAPSASCLQRLAARHREHLDVVIDACQLRLDPAAIAAYLRLGAMVQITGSKFLGGAPFSGALLLPDQIGARAKFTRFPEGLVTMALSQSDHQRWHHLNRCPRDAACLSVIARWRTATAELEAFETIPANTRMRRARRIAHAAKRALRARPELKEIAAPVADRTALGPADPWRGIQTIIPFALHRRRTRTERLMTVEEARQVYHLALCDLSARLPDCASPDERELAARRCHIGQPVSLTHGRGRQTGVLRLCLNASTISRIASRRGETQAKVVSEIETVLDKIALIQRYYDHLCTPSS